jgi:hypothetical protein
MERAEQLPCEKAQEAVALRPRTSGFFDLPMQTMCNDPEHNVPSHLYVPAGQGYRHICPRCGYMQTIVNAPVTMADQARRNDLLLADAISAGRIAK